MPSASNYCGGFWAGVYAFDAVDAYASACAAMSEEATGLSTGLLRGFVVLESARQTVRPDGRPGYGYPAPADEPVWVSADLIGGAVWVAGLDFDYDADAGVVWFDSDPLVDATVRFFVWVDGSPVTAAALFFVSAAPAAAAAYEAGTYQSLAAAVAWACDSPAAAGDETVEAVWTAYDGTYRVVTDASAYSLGSADVPAVAAGDSVSAADPIGTAWTVTRLGPDAPPAGLAHVTVPADYHQGVTSGGVTWYNQTQSTIVDTSGGKTRVRWDLGGTQSDVDAFWAASHATGGTTGPLLAKAMVDPFGPTVDPGTAPVPATVNPLEFVCRELFAGNAYLLVVTPDRFGPDAAAADARDAAVTAAAGLFAAVFTYEDEVPALTLRTPT